MIPDLGKYNTEVLSAYAVSVLLLVLLVLLSLRAGAKAKRGLERAEEKVRNHGR